jgi:uncharacterized small protein (DUF1192 family)
MRRFRVLLLCAMLLQLAPSATRAGEEDLAVRVRTLEKRVAELVAEVRRLEQQLAARRGARPPAARVEGWRQLRSWRSLHKGMSRFEVMQLLGEPGKVSVYYSSERWEYPDALGGRVNFDSSGSVVGWRPPPPGSTGDAGASR